MATNVAIAQLPATTGSSCQILAPNFQETFKFILEEIPLMKPIPTPLAIPPNRLFRAHGISVKCLTLL